MPRTEVDQEIRAIETIIAAMMSLETQAQTRVLRYVFNRLGVSASSIGFIRPGEALPSFRTATDATEVPGSTATDIRSLRAEKQPRSAVEMAALVAFYLSELAPGDERKATISAVDLNKYFKQAAYPLPKSTRFTLGNAVAGGYLDSVSRGQYKLNPVGYNLIAHVLPKSSGDRPPRLKLRKRQRVRSNKAKARR